MKKEEIIPVIGAIFISIAFAALLISTTPKGEQMENFNKRITVNISCTNGYKYNGVILGDKSQNLSKSIKYNQFISDGTYVYYGTLKFKNNNGKIIHLIFNDDTTCNIH